MREITPQQCFEQIQSDAPPLLLDVREDWERQIAKIDCAVHIPMDQVPDRLNELDRNQPVVVMCRSGARSRQVAAFLIQNGFREVTNLAGGISAWSETVDAGIPAY